MANFESGISGYVIATATVTVAFPIDAKGRADVCCRQCYYFRTSSRSCALNGEICSYPEHYVGPMCPLEPQKGDETNEQSDCSDG